MGIPAMFKSNSRNHMETTPGYINVESVLFGLAKRKRVGCNPGHGVIADFAKIMSEEWRAIACAADGYMADLSTEPRWYRVHETFTEDSDLASEIITVLVKNLQGESLNSKSIALTIKHFPGGGPQEGGGDPHYDFGKNQVYPAGKFDYHLAPFRAAVDAGASSIMAYYGIPVEQAYLPNDGNGIFKRNLN